MASAKKQDKNKIMEQRDAIILDEIINKILESKTDICYQDFNKYDHFKDLNDHDCINEFQRLLSYIERYNLAKIIRHGYYPSVKTNEYTKNFKEKGGFAKIYQDELTHFVKEEEKEYLSMKKLKWDIKLSKWQVKTFWPVFVSGLIGFIFGVFNFVDNRNKTKSIEELQQNNQNIQTKVSRLHTLVLDKKTIDSLYNSKNKSDNLRP